MNAQQLTKRNQPLSLAAGHFLINGTGLLPLCFFRGSPMTVFWDPFGLPRFLNFGGSLRPCRTSMQKKNQMSTCYLCGCACIREDVHYDVVNIQFGAEWVQMIAIHTTATLWDALI